MVWTYEMWLGFLSSILGVIIAGTGYYSLHFYYKKDKVDANLSIIAIKSAYTLVISGLIIIVLGLLYLMKIIPW